MYYRCPPICECISERILLLVMGKLVLAFSLITFLSAVPVMAQPLPGQEAQANSTQSVAPDSGAADLGDLHGTLTVPVQVEPTASELDVSKGQQWHRASLTLTGSMCPACLLELQHKLRALPGVSFAAITRETAGDTHAAGEHAKRTAPTVVIYDRNAIEWERMEQCIKGEKYKSQGLTDRQIAPAVKP
jgi:hypothetical protein